MAYAMACDRCGKFYMPYLSRFRMIKGDKASTFAGNSVVLNSPRDLFIKTTNRSVDLCPDCFRKVASSLSGPKITFEVLETVFQDDEKDDEAGRENII